MLASKLLRLQIGELLAADTAFLAPAALNNDVHLIREPFVEDEEATLASLTVADFDGSTALDAGTGTQQVGTDPATNEQVITLLEPAGGWRWEVTGVTNLPQTIYGYSVRTTDATPELIGLKLLDTPIVLTEVGQEVNLGAITIRVVAQPLN